jgi:S-adenosylmethionine hydrolase
LTKIITLTTDFGLRDPYVAEMKAVILGIFPKAVIVDITHKIEKFNGRMGAYVLASAAPYFPKNTIHVVVVDPGVGTKRRALLIQTQQGFLVGPDNGVLALATKKQGTTSVHEITNPKLMLPRVSNTFHGRDVFAPAAAHLANGVLPTDFGPEIQEIAKPQFAKVVFSRGVLTGEVLHIDGFGNIITNVTEEDLAYLHAQDSINVKITNCETKLKLGRTYAENKPKEALAIIGSQGYFEISVNQGSAAKKFQTKPGDKVIFSYEEAGN